MKIMWQFEEKGEWKDMPELLHQIIDNNVRDNMVEFAVGILFAEPPARWRFLMETMQQVRENYNSATDDWDEATTREIRGIVTVRE